MSAYMGGRPQAASLVQGLRPRNAPLQKHASPTVFALPQHRVWRTVPTPPLAASTNRTTDLQPQKLLTTDHRPPTTDH